MNDLNDVRPAHGPEWIDNIVRLAKDRHDLYLDTEVLLITLEGLSSFPLPGTYVSHVAGVDELYEVILSGNQHFSAARDPHRPVGEALRPVTRAHHVTDDRLVGAVPTDQYDRTLHADEISDLPFQLAGSGNQIGGGFLAGL